MNLNININNNENIKREPLKLSDNRLPARIVGVVGGSRKFASDEEAREGLWLVVQVVDEGTGDKPIVLHFNTKFCQTTLSPKSNLSAYMRALTGVADQDSMVAAVKERFLSADEQLDASKLLGVACTANLVQRGDYWNLESLAPVHPKVGKADVHTDVKIPDWVISPFDWSVASVDLVDGLDIEWKRKPLPKCCEVQGDQSGCKDPDEPLPF